MKISTTISSAAEILKEAGVAESRREASSLLAFVSQKDAAFLIAHSGDELDADQTMLFEACIHRRANHEPFQYIVGRQEFYGLEFEVTPDVLIPRPETEILVESAIQILFDLNGPRFCEVGVGSGCISISILHAVKSATAVATDISEAALAVAAINAGKNRVDTRLELKQANIFDGICGPFDMIVSNPPYVPADQLASLQAEVRDYEPRAALDGGKDGLVLIERIIQESPALLKPGGHLLLEIGFDQARKVEELFDRAVWETPPEFLPDLQGIPRIVKVKKSNFSL
jgi:release factor glutamine methyltransferase